MRLILLKTHTHVPAFTNPHRNITHTCSISAIDVQNSAMASGGERHTPPSTPARPTPNITQLSAGQQKDTCTAAIGIECFVPNFSDKHERKQKCLRVIDNNALVYTNGKCNIWNLTWNRFK